MGKHCFRSPGETNVRNILPTNGKGSGNSLLFKETEKFGVYLVAYLAEILGIALEFQTVDVKDE